MKQQEIDTFRRAFQNYVLNYAGILTTQQMADELGFNTSLIIHCAFSLRVSLKIPGVKKKAGPEPEDYATIIPFLKENQKDMTVPEMAKALGETTQRIYHICYRKNIKFKLRFEKQTTGKEVHGYFDVKSFSKSVAY